MSEYTSEYTTEQNLARLRAPLSARDIEWRVGSVTSDKTRGQALPYLTFVAVADRLDDVMGPANWTCEYKPGPAGGVVCKLGLCIEGSWIFKENGADNTEFEAVKGGLTDALKRAAAMWGIGRYLYRFEPPWVSIRDGKYLVAQPTLPDDFLPISERSGVSPAGDASSRKAVGQEQLSKAAKAATTETAPAADEASTVDPETGEVEFSGECLLPEEYPAGLSDPEKDLINELLLRLQRGVPSSLLRGYITGDKGRAKLREPARKFALTKIPA